MIDDENNWRERIEVLINATPEDAPMSEDEIEKVDSIYKQMETRGITQRQIDLINDIYEERVIYKNKPSNKL